MVLDAQGVDNKAFDDNEAVGEEVLHDTLLFPKDPVDALPSNEDQIKNLTGKF